MNPYAAGPAVAPAEEFLPRTSKIAIASALLALASAIGIVGFGAHVYGFVSCGVQPTEDDFMFIGFGFIASIFVAVIGLVLGAIGFFVHRRSRVFAAIATSINGGIVLFTVALLAYGFIQTTKYPS